MANDRGSEGLLPRGPVVWQGPGQGTEIEISKYMYKDTMYETSQKGLQIVW